MGVRVGVLGVGAIGKDHIRRIQETLSGAQVTAVFDVSYENMKQLIFEYPQIKVFTDGCELIADETVDAVVIASATSTHEAYCIEAIRQKKPVFCEKPLAQSAQGAKRVVDAEMAGGQRLVQLGFMRRFDSGYMKLKQLLDSGVMGDVLMAHCAHFNPTYPQEGGNAYVITDTVIHEIDVMNWLLEDYFVAAQVIFPRKSRNAAKQLNDPMVVALKTSKGMLVEVRAFVNCQYGYDIQCEVVCEQGVAKLPEPESITLRRDAKLYQTLLTDWKERFLDAYDVELQAWIRAVSAGRIHNGPTAWDGYCAAVTADACIKAQQSGQWEPIALTPAPLFYQEKEEIH